MTNLYTNDWEIKNVESIIFDKDGTLIDLHYFWGKMSEMRANEIIKRYNLDQNLIYDLCLCLGYDQKSQKMLSDGITALYSRVKIIEIFKGDLLKFNVKISTEELSEIFDYVSKKFYKNMLLYTRPIEEALDFVKKAHSKGIKLGIVTSDSIESTNLTLKQFGWEKYFLTAIGRESHPDTKESGKPTLMALSKMNADPKTTVMIGDAPMDYISAKNAGIENTILIASGQITKDELKKTSPLALESLSEIEFT